MQRTASAFVPYRDPTVITAAQPPRESSGTLSAWTSPVIAPDEACNRAVYSKTHQNNLLVIHIKQDISIDEEDSMTGTNNIATGNSETTEGKNARKLKLLRPLYNPEQHHMYVDALKNAVQQDEVTNIALSGPYGVGKSSILHGFRREYPGAMFVSLSTLGFGKSLDSNTFKSSEGSISPQTNHIQKEIVKQLLYRKPPKKLPASQFKRIQKFDWKHVLPVSALIGLVLTVIIAAIGGFAKIPKVSNSSWCDFGIKFTGVWLLTLVVTEVASHLSQGKVRFDKLTAGPATVTLSQESDSYFDRYLDEIIYFFEMSTCRIVVFEDIDRFSNWEIFEELRELNTLLNNAEQLQDRKSKSNENKIVFIYAMKDSIFEAPAVADTDEVTKYNQDRAIQEIQRANRTKFFDVIIPVVPFVTHRSARDLMRKELDGVSPMVSDELIDHVAKYIPDFRLLRTVCNEYTIYAKFILADNDLKLEPDKLFALMLYKSVHLKDFERIHLGQSKLDEVYRMSVRVTEGLISAINNNYDELEKQQDPHAEAKMRGEALEGMISWTSEHFELRGSSFSVGIGSLKFSEDEIDTVRFWNYLCQQSDGDVMTIEGLEDRYGQSMPLKFSKSDMAKLIGQDLVSPSIIQRTKDSIGVELRQLDADRRKYQSVHMSDLMSDPLAAVPLENGDKQAFSVYVEKTLGSELAAALIRYGYIDRNFVLYASTYHDTFLSANAMTFRMQHIGQGLMNTNYQLDEIEASKLVSDKSIDLREFAQPGAYNVYLLDYLLSNKKECRNHLEAIVGSMLTDVDSGDQLVQAFFVSGGPNYNQISLIDELAPRCSRIFDVLVGLRGVPDGQQIGYVDIALRSISSDVNYDTSLLKEFVERHYKAMATFKDPIADKTVDTLATLLSQACVKFSDIGQIDSKLREHLIKNGCYEVNQHNLECVSGDNQTALDVLSWKRPSVYAYLLQSLEAYFSIIAEDKGGTLSALVGSADTAKVIADVVKVDVSGSTRADNSAADEAKLGDSEVFPHLSNLLASSGGDWYIDLDGLPPGCWPMLAAHDRLAVTTSNLWPYVNKCGVDDALTELLKQHSAIENQGDALSNDEYIKLAVAILEIKEKQISAKQRVALVASIDQVEPIPTSRIEVREGRLVGHLIKARLIADDIISYELTRWFDWPDREFAIASSQRFADYMDIDVVGDDALAMVESQLVPTKVKQNIINSMSSYCSRMDVEALMSLGKSVAAQRELRIDSAALIWMADREVKTDVVVPLVVRELDSLSDSEVRDIVMTLGRPYSDLLIKGMPQVHVDIIAGVGKLLERLKTAGEVSTFKKDDEKHRYVVYRHRWPKL